jgi:hypothetical protein
MLSARINTTLELGHVSDTTISRASAGQIAVEGVNVSMAGHVHDHGALTGLSDDDHPQYPLAASAESITGSWTFDAIQTFGTNSNAREVRVNGPAGSERQVAFQTAGVDRWSLYANVGTESGSNAGSDLEIQAHNDAGTALFSPVIIERATGLFGMLSARINTTLELGHVSDTTLARIAAGRVSIEGVEVARLGAAQEFTAAQQFPTIELGHATDTTLARGAAGELDVEGDRVWNQGNVGTQINALTADATPDGAADYVVTYDASAGAPKKVLLDNLPGGGGASDLVYVGTPADFAINVTSDFTIVSRSVTDIAAGDQILVDAWFLILNNSGATRNYVITFSLDGAFDVEHTLPALATSSTLEHWVRVQCVFTIRSTSLAFQQVHTQMQLAAGLSDGGDTTAAATHLEAKGFARSTSDLTGSSTVTFVIRSASTAATQTLRLNSFTIRKVTPT